MYSFPRLINLWGAPHRPVLPYLSLHSSSLQPPILVRQKMGLTWDLLGTHLGLTRLCERTESWVWLSLNHDTKILLLRHVWNECHEIQKALSRISNIFDFLQFLQITVWRGTSIRRYRIIVMTIILPQIRYLSTEDLTSITCISKHSYEYFFYILLSS